MPLGRGDPASRPLRPDPGRKCPQPIRPTCPKRQRAPLGAPTASGGVEFDRGPGEIVAVVPAVGDVRRADGRPLAGGTIEIAARKPCESVARGVDQSVRIDQELVIGVGRQIRDRVDVQIASVEAVSQPVPVRLKRAADLAKASD